jgi:hypothetical protein
VTTFFCFDALRIQAMVVSIVLCKLSTESLLSKPMPVHGHF